MRKILLSLICGASSLLAWAEYPYMAFKTLDGCEQTIRTAGLEITFADGVLTANAAEEAISIPLENLVSMQFTDRAAKAEIAVVGQDSEVSVFRADGTLAGTYPSVQDATRALDAGLYVFKNSKGETWKIVVQK